MTIEHLQKRERLMKTFECQTARLPLISYTLWSTVYPSMQKPQRLLTCGSKLLTCNLSLADSNISWYSLHSVSSECSALDHSVCLRSSSSRSSCALFNSCSKWDSRSDLSGRFPEMRRLFSCSTCHSKKFQSLDLLLASLPFTEYSNLPHTPLLNKRSLRTVHQQNGIQD